MIRCSKIDMLHPLVIQQFRKLERMLDQAMADGKLTVQFQVFETYRSPERQAQLFALGRTQPGSIVTKAKPWQSPHQFGLAADFVPRVRDKKKAQTSLKWDWDAATDQDWSTLASFAAEVGLSCPIVWDRPHVEAVDIWADFRTIIAYREGPQSIIPFPGAER